MRILRGQSNLEVSSKGFAWFVVGLVLATFVGGAVRTVLNSSQVHERIVTELKNRFPKHEFQIGATEVLLSRGIWPGLGLRLRDVTFRQDVCGKLSFMLSVPQATLPLDLLSLIKGRIRLNDVEIEGGGLHLDYRPCEKVPDTARPAEPGGRSSGPVSPVVAESPPPMIVPKVNWAAAAKFADGIELKKFSVTYEKSPTWKLMFNTAYLSLSDEVFAQALVDVQKSLPFGTLTHPVEFDLRGDNNVVQWNFNADFKEGHVHVNGSLDLNNQAGLMKAVFRQVPVSDLMSEAFQSGLVDREFKLKATWLTCSMKWEGRLHNFAAAPVAMRDCKVEGGYGRAELEQADLWLGGPEFFKTPAHVKVTQLQVQPMVEALNRQVLPAVLSKLGVWTGAFDFSGSEKWKLDGHLQNVEIAFSNQSIMGKQVIESMRTMVQRSGGRVAAQVDQVRFREGEFAGRAQFDLSHDWRDGTFHAESAKLVFSPSIQKLLVGVGMGPVKAQAKGALSMGELTQWNGTFSTPEVQGEGWKVEGVQLDSKYQGGAVHVNGSARNAVVTDAWRIYSQLKIARPQAPNQLRWNDLNTRIEFHKNGGVIHSAIALEAVSNQSWRGKGAWAREGVFTGTLSINGGGKNTQIFALRGEKGSLTVEEAAGAAR